MHICWSITIYNYVLKLIKNNFFNNNVKEKLKNSVPSKYKVMTVKFMRTLLSSIRKRLLLIKHLFLKALNRILLYPVLLKIDYFNRHSEKNSKCVK